ncbi:GNAT family N-acetyltransferase [Melissospora conviva]|uniref:GNAT family N-acetyltransferase n=1 Tax=Melissospora conviva TaxID=3388432 RepID=UPI003C152BAB
MEIRPARPDDAPALVALRAVVYPYLVRGVESTRKMISEPPPGENWAAFVAEIDGRLVGWASSYLHASTSEPGFGEISLLHVHPGYRRQGAGSALFAACVRHLRQAGARRVRTFALEQSLEYARRRGFEPSRAVHYSALPLRPAPAVPPTPPGVRLVPLSDLDPMRLYEAHVAAAADEPGDVAPDANSYESWRYGVWTDPGLDRCASVAATANGEIIGFTLVTRDGERMWSEMTATLPQHRGRGLALLVKSAALQRAAEGGVTVAYTSNDESNAPMLAVNSRLGYCRVATQWSCLFSR